MFHASICRGFGPGHHTHPIQITLASTSPRTPRSVVLLQREDGLLDVLVDNHLERWRVHWLSEPVLRVWDVHRTARLLDHGLLVTHGGGLYPCRDLADWHDCP